MQREGLTQIKFGRDYKMRSDINGCSTCSNGTEQFETFNTRKGNMVQYDFRTTDGRLFSCVAGNLSLARAKRDHWLKLLPA